MMNKPGALSSITKGISTTIESGVRVSANMIISEPNQSHVYETARLCSLLGVQNLFATRLVPAVDVQNPEETDFRLGRESALRAIDQMLEAKNDFGIAVGTLIGYPLCLLGDLMEYEDFVGRGCPAQRGNRMVINANGQTHACTHENASYGNVFEIGIKAAFKRMHSWHDGSYLYQGCRDCIYINVCSSGCRSAAYAYFRDMVGKDPLFEGPEQITRDYQIFIPPEVTQLLDKGEPFIVPNTIRFRQEEGFYSINIRWANAFPIESDAAAFLMEKQRKRAPITAAEMIGENPFQEFVKLIFKEALIPLEASAKAGIEAGIKKGCSIDPDDLPFPLDL